jgi:hypothetical protein
MSEADGYENEGRLTGHPSSHWLDTLQTSEDQTKLVDLHTVSKLLNDRAGLET